MHSNRFLLILILLLPVLLLASCAAPTAAPTPTSTVIQVTATPAPTGTARPSLTPPPTATPAATETLPPATMLPPTPDTTLSDVKLLGLAWYSDYDLLLSFQFSEPVDPENYRITLEEKEYKCEVLAQFPNRLYCKGQGAKVLAVANVRVYPAGSDQPGFEQDVWVPYFQ